MRFPLIVLGSLLNILGVLWTLQSLSVIPGSMMAGQSSWVAAGGMALVAGAIVTAVGARAARRQQ